VTWAHSHYYSVLDLKSMHGQSAITVGFPARLKLIIVSYEVI
jgi:hypothetical protein